MGAVERQTRARGRARRGRRGARLGAEGVGRDHPLRSAPVRRPGCQRSGRSPIRSSSRRSSSSRLTRGGPASAVALTGIGYPLPGAWQAFEGGCPTPPPLEALLGDQRAGILIRLERPATAGDIAATMYASPGAASYQLRALESAGLVTRSRRGRSGRGRADGPWGAAGRALRRVARRQTAAGRRWVQLGLGRPIVCGRLLSCGLPGLLLLPALEEPPFTVELRHRGFPLAA